MTIQITIIGMGQIGTSVGLALAEQKELVRRVGHDKELKLSRQAEKMGALDRVEINLPHSVRDADLVLLALPVDQIKPTLEIIASDLKEGAVVMDTAPVKETVAAWAKELLPEGRYYVGLTPVLNPAYLQTHDFGTEAAHADLFHSGMLIIVTPPGIPSEAIRLATDLTRLLGAQHLFADPVEVDSLMAATHLLPLFMAAALLNATVDQPGWQEGRRFAGRAYAEVTGPIGLLGEPGAISSAALLTRQNILRVIDSLIAELHTFRTDIQDHNEKALIERLERARLNRFKWWEQRQAANWRSGTEAPGDMPTASETFGRMFGLGRKPKPKS